jgi:hypothetical protein
MFNLYYYDKFYKIKNLLHAKNKIILDTTYEIGYHVLFRAVQESFYHILVSLFLRFLIDAFIRKK